MKSHHKMLFSCILCVAAICLSASATVTVRGNPTISIEPTGVIAVGEMVTINYVDTVTLSPGDSFADSVTWNCYVDGDLNTNFPTTDAIPVKSIVTSFPVASGSFSFSETTVGTHTVYCTAQGEVTPSGGSAQSVSGTTNTVTFTVASCTGQATIGAPEENDDEPASYIQLRWPINATMNPAYSGNQSQTTAWYQGIDGDLTNHSPNLDIDCEGGNNDDPPAQNPTITPASQTSGSGSVTFTFNVQQYDYSWDICDQNTCPPPPPDGVENVQVTKQALQKPQFTFQCGK